MHYPDMPREKLLQQGPQALSDAELLAIFYRVGLKNKPVINLAAEHLATAGSLRQLIDVPYAQAQAWPGMGLSKYASLQAALELGTRYLGQTLKRTLNLSQLTTVVDCLRLQLRAHEHEVMVGLFLDAKNHFIAFAQLAQGGLSTAQLYPRTLVKQALNYNAAGLIVAHNHPSGDPTPSQADRQMTDALKALLATIEIRLLDHIVLGEGRYFSFAAEGYL